MLSFVVLIAPVGGEARVTVAQLEQFLTSSRAAKLSDAQIAHRLGQVMLSEQLTATALRRIGDEAELGPKTAEQLELMAAASIFEVPPSEELPDSAPPDEAAQAEIVRAARNYVNSAVHLLPDFLAVRVTRSFDNLPITEGKKHTKPEIAMHFVGEFRREISIRSGREVHGQSSDAGTAAAQPAAGGFSTWGEFGAILAIVLGDSFDGNVTWSRWQRGETGARVAVFRYTVPRAASHDTVDFCCYANSEDAPAIYSFHDKPGYHGEIYVDPVSGKIGRITLEAELNESDPVTRSKVAVEYGAVSIAGRRYVCPIRSVAVSEVHNVAMRKIDGVGLEEHVNVVQFGKYHKFGSTARIITNPQ